MPHPPGAWHQPSFTGQTFIYCLFIQFDQVKYRKCFLRNKTNTGSFSGVFSSRVYVGQDGDQVFNRAKLLNIGFAESLKDYDYDCFIFSDVDLIPMDDRNTYKCYSQPRHLSVSMDKFGFR